MEIESLRITRAVEVWDGPREGGVAGYNKVDVLGGVRILIYTPNPPSLINNNNLKHNSPQTIQKAISHHDSHSILHLFLRSDIQEELVHFLSYKRLNNRPSQLDRRPASKRPFLFYK